MSENKFTLALLAARSLIFALQENARDYVDPQGITAEAFAGRMVETLDGPEERKTLKLIEDALSYRSTSESCEGFWQDRHDWSKWKVIERGNIQRNRDNSDVGVFLIQERVCAACGKTELDQQKVHV